MINGVACAGNACGSSTAGTYTVTATNGTVTTTASLTVTPGPLASLSITPTASTIALGSTQPYTATGYDGKGNSLGNVTGSTVFTVTDPNAMCTANVCGSSTSSTYTVTATDGSAQTSAALTVSSSPVASMVISPTASTIAAGATQPYTVTGYDGKGNSLGDVTRSTVFTVTDPNVTCTANVCGSSTSGTYTVTATDGSAQTSAGLTVTPGPLALLAITPTVSTITVVGTQRYTVTGYDGKGNSLGDVTGSTVLTVTDPNVTCTANVCGSSTPGTYTITATDGIAQTSSALTVSVPLWSTQAIHPAAVTGAGPGATSLNGQLWIAWRITTGNKVAIAGYNPSTGWTAPVIQPVAATDNSPGIAALNGKLYVVWTGRSSNSSQVAISSYDPTATATVNPWSSPTYVAQALSDHDPAIVALNGQLWVAWKSAASNQIGYASFDPILMKWSAPALHPQAATGNRPALAAVGNYLYLGWTTLSSQMGYSFEDPAVGPWSSQAFQPAAANLKAGPALTASGSLLYAAWVTNTHKIAYASYDSRVGTWSAMTLQPQAAADNGPALTLVGSGLALVWKVQSLNELAYAFYG